MNPNSALNWLPAIEAAGLPVPRTIMIPYDHQSMSVMFAGQQSPEFERLIVDVQKAASDIGRPCFIRTDLASAKHSGPAAYLLLPDSDAGRVLFYTIEDSEMKFWMEPEGPRSIMIREFLSLEFHFTAFGGLPIAREWRFFATSEKVICSHPYWPIESLEGHVDEAAYPDWIFWLQQIHEPPPDHLVKMAIVAASAAGDGAWSVDFCLDVNGKWWLVDMATMKDSWHWSGCPNG